MRLARRLAWRLRRRKLPRNPEVGEQAVAGGRRYIWTGGGWGFLCREGSQRPWWQEGQR